MPVDGVQHLRRFLTERAAQASDTFAGTLTPFDLIEARGVARGLVAAETMTAAQSETILRDAAAEAGAATISNHSPRRFRNAPRHSAPPEDHPPSLLGVVPLNQGQNPVILSIDAWTTMFTVRLAYPDTTDIGRIVRDEQPCEAMDDLGIHYAEISRATTDAGGVLTSTRHLRPALNPQARTLTIALDEDTTINIAVPKT